MTDTPIKTRFCPSPTGFVHLGNIRTALFNVLLAKNLEGIFLLRIEDTDKARSETRYTEALQTDMRWLGLDWNEGPEKDRGNGPYWQSQRQDIYDSYYHQLEQQGRAYPCFCTEQQLALSRKVQAASGKPPRYLGTCKQLTAEQIAQKLAAGEKPALRFRVPADQTTGFVDLVRGEQQFNNNDIGDFIIRRADGTAPFMYCNAIDDALMGVTHALRGEDHLTNTPRQLMILQALDLPTPHYGHISLIIGHDGTPLSKRHGSRNIQELRAEGYLPMAIVNYLARLGHHYSNEHWMTLAELSEKFSINSLGAAPARFDAHQLLRWQHETLLRLSVEELWNWLGADVQKAIPATQKDLFLQTIRTNIAFPADALHWAQRLFTDHWDYGDAEQQVLQTTGSAFFQTAITAAETHGANLEAITAALKTQQNVKGKQLFQPLRVALTGELNGPELVPVLEILGADGVVARLKRALTATNN